MSKIPDFPNKDNALLLKLLFHIRSFIKTGIEGCVTVFRGNGAYVEDMSIPGIINKQNTSNPKKKNVSGEEKVYTTRSKIIVSK